MRRALALAEQGLREGELPIGSVVVLDDAVVAEAFWRGDPERGVLGHPELLALLEADRSIGRRRREATLYTTLEPCLMCMGAAMSFFLGIVVYALASPTDGAARVAAQWAPAAGHPEPSGRRSYGLPKIVAGVGREESAALVRSYLRGGPSGPIAAFAGTLVNA
jgi:tRNA(adenine34) deaminase